MSLQKDIRDRLRDNAAIDEEIGDAKWGARIYAGNVPQGVTFPCIVITKIGGDPNYTFGGESLATDTTLEIASLATKEHKAVELDEMVRQSISGLTGTVGDQWLLNCDIESETVRDEYRRDGSDQVIYEAATIYRIGHTRPAPSLA